MHHSSTNRNPKTRAIPLGLAAILTLALALGGAAPSPTYAAAPPGASLAAEAMQATYPAQTRAAKWILIDLSDQRLMAYQGNKTIYTWRVSTGIIRYPTVVGTFRVYAKLPKQRMQGGRGADYYNLPNVPDVMYFHRGYAIHGAYWHNNFGRPMSHGCVNMPLAAAAWLYDWAPMGTAVVVRR
jgi:lipoprotein-anchoring transpeptidase ErfK/SrfK